MNTLTPDFAVPVVVIVYNRPRLVRNLIGGLRRVKPRHLLIVSDGPKPEKREDNLLVEATRRELEAIDWPCQIDRNYAETNLGLDLRIRSGLDWAFGIVDQAIILEDDINAVPDFFYWSERMLDTYRDRDDVAMICGHNPLIRWPEGSPGTSAVLSQRGAWYGWATYARAWNSVQQWDLTQHANSIEKDIAQQGFEPALSALYLSYLNNFFSVRQVAPSHPLLVDVDFTLKMALSGRFSVCSPVNFIHHLGVGPDATNLIDCDETLFHLPRHKLEIPAIIRALPEGAVDYKFDRAKVLMELLVRANNPRMARKLARFRNLSMDFDLRVHLLPFLHADETTEIIDHLHAEGLEDLIYNNWHSALSDLPNQGGAT
jgi:hypothetical protein